MKFLSFQIICQMHFDRVRQKKQFAGFFTKIGSTSRKLQRSKLLSILSRLLRHFVVKYVKLVTEAIVHIFL